MKPPTDREKEIYEALMKDLRENDQAPEEESKARVAKRYGVEPSALDQIIIKVMAYSV